MWILAIRNKSKKTMKKIMTIDNWAALNGVLMSHWRFNRTMRVPESCYCFVVEMDLGTKDSINDSYNVLMDKNDTWGDEEDSELGTMVITEEVVLGKHRAANKLETRIPLVFRPNYELEFGQVKIFVRPHPNQKSISSEVCHAFCGVFN
jgi:hypothetical protein